MIKLSVLIATMPSRQKVFFDLLFSLKSQINFLEDHKIIPPDSVELIYDAGPDVIGTKRNKLLKQAAGEYVVFVDDDDKVCQKYIEKIMGATESSPDCIGISGTILIGGEQRQWHISKDFKEWYEENNIYYRTPNHISPVRREIAIKSWFPPVRFSEDFEYSNRIFPHLKTEVIIPGNIYFYTPSKK